MQSGALLHSTQAQRRYASLNYTHVARALARSRRQRDRAEGRALGRRHAAVAVVQYRPDLRCDRRDRRARPAASVAGRRGRSRAAVARRQRQRGRRLLRHRRRAAGPLPEAVRAAAAAGQRCRLRDRLPRQHAGARRRHAADRHRRAGRCAVPRAGAAPHRQRRLSQGAARAGLRRRPTIPTLGPFVEGPVRLQRDDQRRIPPPGRGGRDQAQGGRRRGADATRRRRHTPATTTWRGCEREGEFLHGAFYLGSPEFYEWLRNLPDGSAPRHRHEARQRGQRALRRQRGAGTPAARDARASSTPA